MEIAEKIVATANAVNGDALNQLSAAAWQAVRMQYEADGAVRTFVELALDAGASWVEVGGLLGIGQQAARERFGPESAASTTEPLSLYTEDASNALTTASKEARLLGSGYLGTEHLLLGLLDNPAYKAARAIEQLGVSGASIRDTVNEQVVRREMASYGHLDATGRAQAVLQTLAPREMRLAEENSIDTDIVLLALLEDEGGTASKILGSSGVTKDRVRSWRARSA